MSKTVTNKQHIAGTVIKSMRKKGYISESHGSKFALESSDNMDSRFVNLQDKLDSLFGQQFSALEKYTQAIEMLAKESAQYKVTEKRAVNEGDGKLADTMRQLIDAIADMADTLSLNNMVTKQLSDNVSDYTRQNAALEQQLRSQVQATATPRSFKDAEAAYVETTEKAVQKPAEKKAAKRTEKLVINAQSVLLNVTKELANAFTPKQPKNVERKSGVSFGSQKPDSGDGSAVLLGMALWKIFDNYFGDSSVIGAGIRIITDAIVGIAKRLAVTLSKGAQQALEMLGNKGAKKAAEKTAEEVAEQAGRKAAERAGEKAVLKGAEKTGVNIAERGGESLLSRAARSVGVKGAEKIGGRATNGIPVIGPLIGGVVDYNVRRKMFNQSVYQSAVGAVASTIGGEIGQFAGAAGGAVVGGVTGVGVGAIPGAGTGAFVGGVGGSLIGGEIADRFTGASNAEILGNDGNKKLDKDSIVKMPSGSAQEAFNFFTSQNFTPEQAAGIVGNLQVESGLNPSSYNPSDKTGDAYGIAQWHPDRRAEFKRIFKKDMTESTFSEQLNFIMHELNTGNGVARGTLNALRSARTPAEAATIFDKMYEKSSGDARQTRIRNAENLFNQLTGNKPISSASPTSSKGPSPATMAPKKAVASLGKKASPSISMPADSSRVIANHSQTLNSVASTNTGSSSAPVIINNNNVVAPTNVAQGGGGGSGITTTLVRNADNSFLRNQDKHHNRFV